MRDSRSKKDKNTQASNATSVMVLNIFGLSVQIIGSPK
jgi:hypothetical protein